MCGTVGKNPIIKRILLIEDDPGYSRAVRHTLEREGYEVLYAPNGLQGLIMAQNENPDLVVLDVMLPGIDGFEISSRLRADPSTVQLPILMLSAKDQEEDSRMGFSVGANQYLTKPVDNAVLLGTIEAMLQEKA